MFKKVYFPRLLLPFGSVISGLVDFAIAFIVLLGMMAYYDMYPGWSVIMLPIFLMLAIAAALSVGLWLSALNVKYRDIGYPVPVLTQISLFASPVAYSSSLVPEKWQALYAVNPMVGVIEGFRWALLGKVAPFGPMMMISVTATIVLLVGGLFFFRRMEKTFADIV